MLDLLCVQESLLCHPMFRVKICNILPKIITLKSNQETKVVYTLATLKGDNSVKESPIDLGVKVDKTSISGSKYQPFRVPSCFLQWPIGSKEDIFSQT